MPLARAIDDQWVILNATETIYVTMRLCFCGRETGRNEPCRLNVFKSSHRGLDMQEIMRELYRTLYVYWDHCLFND
jgi:hypothetical protein